MTWVERLGRRSRREWLAALLVLGGLLGFVVLVYGLVVLAGGALLGRTSSPDVALSVLATAVVALAFDRVQSWLDRLASLAVNGGRASPYDVLRQFTGTVTGRYAAEELPARMARVLAQGTGAEWSQVWLVVPDRPTLAATWPPGTPVVVGEDPLDEAVPGRRSQAVHHGGELLGVLVVQERDQVRLTSVEERLFAGLASQAGLVLRGARLRAELEKRAAELSARADELRLSRQRLVDAQDERRRGLERDIHDGAQQHLVALAVNLRLAQTLVDGAPDRAERLIAGQEKAAADAVETLLQLARGIYPRLLEEAGVAAAVRAAVGSAGVEVEITADGVDRYAADVEAAAYFCCLEALQNAAKHAGVTQVRVTLRGKPGSLEVIVQDDGGGFDPATTPTGSGLVNMRDRVESIGGTLVADSEPGGGTCIAATLPDPAVSPVGGRG